MKIISTGNEEIDTHMGGGLPMPSLVVIEGEHGTGKTVVAAQFIKGILDADMKVLCVTENTVRDYLQKMKSVTFDFSKQFLQNKLIIESLQIQGLDWSAANSSLLLSTVEKYIASKSKKINCVVIDSLSLLTLHSNHNTILNFITKCKHLVSNGMSVVITMHPESLSSEIGMRLKSASDGYIHLSSSKVGDKAVKIMKTIKLIGSVAQPEPQFAFDIDPIFGLKIVPISMSGV